jgi:hypothetical protein
MATSARAVTERSAEHRFYAAMAFAMFAVVYVGFARSFFLRPWFPEIPVPPERFFLLHGLVFASWMVLLLVQPLLVAAGRSDLHRRLGKFGVILALGVVVSGVYGALLAAGRPGGFIGVPVPPAAFVAIPLFDMLMFAAFVTLALCAVRNPQAHKRWMLLAAMSLLTAALARWPGDPLGKFGMLGVFALGDAFLLPLAAWDLRSRGRLHPVTAWGGLALVASQPLRLAISGTAAWAAFAGTLIGLLA